MESQSKIPEFRINPENFHPCISKVNFQTPKNLDTVNSEICARILFSPKALKDIFATLKFVNKA